MFPFPSGQPQKALPAIVFWIIWFAMISGIPIYQFVLGGGIPHGSNAPTSGLNPILIMAVGQILVATVVRWVVIPRMIRAGQLLTLMIVGVALSEAVEFYGIFLFPANQPETKLSLFILSLVGIAQFMPVYAQPESAGSTG